MRFSANLICVSLLATWGLGQSADLSDYDRAAQRVEQRSREVPRSAARARNVILFVGDGMGISTITAARILEGQRRGEAGEDNRLSFEEFPYTALVRTFSANQQVSDSAPTATAMVTAQEPPVVPVAQAQPASQACSAICAPGCASWPARRSCARCSWCSCRCSCCLASRTRSPACS